MKNLFRARRPVLLNKWASARFVDTRVAGGQILLGAGVQSWP